MLSLLAHRYGETYIAEKILKHTRTMLLGCVDTSLTMIFKMMMMKELYIIDMMMTRNELNYVHGYDYVFKYNHD